MGKRLVANIEFIEIKTKQLWEGQPASIKEVKLIMQTLSSRLKNVEAEVAKLHSNKQFVLEEIPGSDVSAQSAKELREGIKE